MQDVVELSNSLLQRVYIYMQRVGWTSTQKKNSFRITCESNILSHQWVRAGEFSGQNITCASPVSMDFVIILHMYVIFLVGWHI